MPVELTTLGLGSESMRPDQVDRGPSYELADIAFGPGEVTFVNGYFDLTHAGHVQFLRACKAIGNPLVVGVTAAELSVKPDRPIVPDLDRAMVVGELKPVDFAFINRHPYPDVINRIRPRAVVFSYGETPNEVKSNEAAFIQDHHPDISIVLIPRQRDDISTSQIISRILASSLPGGEALPDNIEAVLRELSKTSNASMGSAALVARGKQLISEGVNYHPKITGNPVFSRTDTHECATQRPRPTHAEADALLKAIAQGVDVRGTALHTLHMPCAGCAEMAVRLGVAEVIYYLGFDNNYGELILRENGVKLTKG